MSSLNKVMLIGNAGRDAELRHTASGMAVANVSIATTSKRKDRQTNEVIEDTQWHRVTFYERLAEIAGEYIKKGTKVYVEGVLKYGKYTDKDGVEKPTTDIIANSMTLLSGREQGDGGQQRQPQQRQQQDGYQRPHQRQSAPAQRQPQQRGGGGGGSGFDDMDDDVPFISCAASFDMESKLDRRMRRRAV